MLWISPRSLSWPESLRSVWRYISVENTFVQKTFRNYLKHKLCSIKLYTLYKEFITSALFQNVMRVWFPKLNLVSLHGHVCTLILYQYTVHVLIFDTWKYTLNVLIYSYCRLLEMDITYITWILTNKKPNIRHLLKEKSHRRYMYMPVSHDFLMIFFCF